MMNHTETVTYEVRSLDMWGHVSADCESFGCPCVDEDEDGKTHDDNRCQCAEECNNEFRVGSIEVSKDATDDAILDALLAEGFLSKIGREICEIDDFSDGSMLDVNDNEGRRIFHLVSEEP